MRPPNLDAKAKARAMAAAEESFAAGLRMKAGLAKVGFKAKFLKAAALRDCAARAFYEAAFEYGRGEGAKAMKREVDAKRHISAAESVLA